MLTIDAIYGVPWIPSIYPQIMLALIYQHQPDPSWLMENPTAKRHACKGF